MKKYIKPNVLIVRVKVEKLLQYSLKSVGGLDGVTKGEGEFIGGVADSRRNRYWDDEEDEFEY